MVIFKIDYIQYFKMYYVSLIHYYYSNNNREQQRMFGTRVHIVYIDVRMRCYYNTAIVQPD